MSNKIRPFLWFDNNAEEAITFYTSVFKDSEVFNISRSPEEASGSSGQVQVATFRLGNQEFGAFNGGPHFRFTEAVSFMVDCANQDEVDYYWNALSEGGEESQCGWLKDRFGLSWQIVPSILGELMSSGDAARSGNVMQALLKMTKIDVATLQQAYDEA